VTCGAASTHSRPRRCHGGRNGITSLFAALGRSYASVRRDSAGRCGVERKISVVCCWARPGWLHGWVDYRQLFTDVRQRPGMFGLDGTFHDFTVFVRGCEAGNDWQLLAGFRESLIARLAAGNNLGWEGLVLHLAFPDRPVSPDRHAVSRSAKASSRFAGSPADLRSRRGCNAGGPRSWRWRSPLPARDPRAAAPPSTLLPPGLAFCQDAAATAEPTRLVIRDAVTTHAAQAATQQRRPRTRATGGRTGLQGTFINREASRTASMTHMGVVHATTDQDLDLGVPSSG
jgi:hypothetical protein